MDKITQRLTEILARRKEIETELREAKDEQLDALEKEVMALNEEQVKLRKELVTAHNELGKEIVMPNGSDSVVKRKADLYETIEYREAFRDYVTGANKNLLKFRTDETSEISDVSAIIPVTIMDKVIQSLRDFGEILPRVTFTNYKGGVSIPIGGTRPTASWTLEGVVADKQKFQINTNFTFTYHKLQLRVAITLMASVVSLDVWERTVAKDIAEAFAIALETGVINGSGTNQMLGITEDLDLGGGEGRIPQAQQHNFLTTDGTYEGWLNKLIGNIPIAYRKKRNGVILMNPATWDKYVQGLVDTDGHPIARVTWGMQDEMIHRMFGRSVILTELLSALETATDTHVVAIYCDLADYMINTNLALQYRQYFDEDTDEYIRKATLICDGKPADIHGMVILKKAS